jgi:hypothetical protein
MHKKLILISSFALALSPMLAFAATADCGTLTGIGKIICQIKEILNAIIPVLVALGVVYFIWGVIRYVIAAGEEDKEKGKAVMIYGIIGLSVIVGLGGLVNIVVETFGLSGTAPLGININGGAGAGCAMGTNFQGVLGYITCIINSSIIPLIFALAVVMFIWGAVNFFIINADEEAKREQGKQFMIWGILALTVMLSVWGLVAILGSTFGINTSILPQVKPPTDTGGSGGVQCGGSTYGACPGGKSCTGTSPNFTCSTID